ncbi:MAG: peptidoglycan DD-metalloendopeptidase family protein [Bacteroidales bacterium]|nr:peptidoglycan DD-metalloendopeptidase family protein [Bacteroidales bacterium]
MSKAQEIEDNFDQENQDTTFTDDYFNDELLTTDELIYDSNAVAFNEWFFSHSTVIYNFTKAPANDLYQLWDTVFVHPYKFDILKILDSVNIKLVDDMSYYVHPVKNIITSNFGLRHWRYHFGIDLKVKVGDSILCAFDGMVRVSKRSKSYGNVIVVRHNNSLETVYAHLSASNVKTNQIVRAGDLLGYGGNTGRSTGPHLHFEIRYLGQPINPATVIDFANYKLVSNELKLNKGSFKYLIEARRPRFYKVKKGDYLGKISKKLRVPVKTLCRLNRIKSTTPLKVGKYIRYR